jgi:hypothetical protein
MNSRKKKAKCQRRRRNQNKNQRHIKPKKSITDLISRTVEGNAFLKIDDAIVLLPKGWMCRERSWYEMGDGWNWADTRSWLQSGSHRVDECPASELVFVHRDFQNPDQTAPNDMIIRSTDTPGFVGHNSIYLFPGSCALHGSNVQSCYILVTSRFNIFHLVSDYKESIHK